MSDLFEAHMGGLVEEGRHQEVDVWVREFLNNLETDLRARAKTLETEARNRSKETRSEIKKRGRERNVFDGGWETGEFRIADLTIGRCELKWRMCYRPHYSDSPDLAPRDMPGRSSENCGASSLPLGRQEGR